MNDIIGLLVKIGLKEIEAKIYLELVKVPRLTGYKIAANIDKPVANTYKALKSLEKLNLIKSSKYSSKKVFVANSIEKFLDRKKETLDQTILNIKSNIKSLSESAKDKGLYNLDSLEQIDNTIMLMIKKTQKDLMIKATNFFWEKVQKYLNPKRRERLNINLILESDIDLSGCKINKMIQKMEHEIIEVVSDEEEYLTALYDSKNDVLLSAFINNEPNLTKYLIKPLEVTRSIPKTILIATKEDTQQQEIKEETIKQVAVDNIIIQEDGSIYDDEKNLFSIKELREYYGSRDLKPWHNPLTDHGEHGFKLYLRDINTQNLIGICNLYDWNKSIGLAKITFIIKEEHRRKGYMKKAIEFSLNKAFGELNLKGLSCYVHERNIATLKLLNNFGFSYKGKNKKVNHFSFGIGFEKIYNITKDEYVRQFGVSE